MSSISNLESLPDEILLEICKYLLCVDVLLSFDNLNTRVTRMMNDYYQHVSLHKASYTQSHDLCVKILPRIGSKIHTFVIDNCYSALQAISFPKYFQNSMSVCFPQLEKIILVSFRPDPLLKFLQTLYNLDKLHTIDIRSLFRVPTNQQTEVLLALLQTNNNRLKSIYIDDQSSHLNPVKKYLPKQILCPNIINLKIEISTICDLSVLFTILPNINRLSVSIHKKDNLDHIQRIFSSCKLNFLTEFQLKSVDRSWYLHELIFLIEKLPSIKYLSLNLRTSDPTLTNGDILKKYLPNTIEQFHYSIHYLPERIHDQKEIVNTWKDIRSVTCLFNSTQNDYMYLHTLPYRSFSYLEISSSVAQSILNNTNSYEHIERIHVDCDLEVAEAFPILRYCRRARHVMIWLHGKDRINKYDGNSVEEEIRNDRNKTLPKMSRLRRLTLVGNLPQDLYHVSTILLAAPNLFRLDVNYMTLLVLLDDKYIWPLLRQRITALTINNMSHCSLQEEKHIQHIASVFLYLRHLYVDMRFFDMNIDTVVLCYFDEFSKHKAPLISFCADGRPSNEMKNDARKWLIDNRSQLEYSKFLAFFNEKAGRLLIWM